MVRFFILPPNLTIDKYKVLAKLANGSIITIDGSKLLGVVLEEIAELNRTSAPRRPLRILLMEQLGCGKTAQAKKIDEKYKITFIKVNSIIKDMIH
jgi:hypothetical protein